GNEKIVSEGEAVYTGFFDTNNTLLLELSAGDLDLENNISYTVTASVSMSSGLTAESSVKFTVAWEDDFYTPNAEIGYDEEKYITYVRPYCVDSATRYYQLEYSFNNGYSLTDTLLDEVNI